MLGHDLSAGDPPATGADVHGDTLDVPLLGNRVDRFVWDGTTLPSIGT